GGFQHVLQLAASERFFASAQGERGRIGHEHARRVGADARERETLREFVDGNHEVVSEARTDGDGRTGVERGDLQELLAPIERDLQYLAFGGRLIARARDGTCEPGGNAVRVELAAEFAVEIGET